MRRFIAGILFFLAPLVAGFTQCDSLLIDITDDFDSTRLVAARAINIGYLVPSQFETIDGFKMIEEAKVLFSFTQNDTLDAFFMTLAVQEREYRKIRSGTNVLLALSNKKIVGLLNLPDKGVFDRTTNMRRYLHTTVIPYDQVFNLAYNTIKKIRIEYEGGYKHDIVILPEQAEMIKEQILCVAERLNIFPTKP